MKIIITENQLKLLIVSEQVNSEQLLYGKAPIAQTDSEFPNWLATNFPSVVNKYAGSPYPWDTNTISKIRNENSINSDPVGQFINVGKKWDAYKAYKTSQQQIKIQSQQYNVDYQKEMQKKAQEDAEVKKREQLYNQAIAARNAENERLEKQGFTVKRDVLDPKKIMGSSAYNKIEWCNRWYAKYPDKPCVTEGEKLLEGEDMPAWVDWLVTALEWLFPQFSFIKKIYEIATGIYYFVKAKAIQAQEAVNATIYYIYGIAQILKAFKISITIPGLNTITKNVYNFLNSKQFGSILTNINVAFKNAPKWLQTLSVIIGKFGGDKIAEVVINIINAILFPIQQVIEYISPATAEYIKNFAEFLKGLGSILVEGGKLVNDSPNLKQILVPS